MLVFVLILKQIFVNFSLLLWLTILALVKSMCLVLLHTWACCERLINNEDYNQ